MISITLLWVALSIATIAAALYVESKTNAVQALVGNPIANKAVLLFTALVFSTLVVYHLQSLWMTDSYVGVVLDKKAIKLSGKVQSTAYSLEMSIAGQNQSITVTPKMFVDAVVNDCIAINAYQPFTESTLTATSLAVVDQSNCQKEAGAVKKPTR